MKTFNALILATALGSANALAAAPDAAVEAAFNQLDTKRLETLQAELGSDYGRAYAGYRLAIARHLRDEGGASDALSEVVDRLEADLEARKAAADNSNRAALLAMTYGYKIALSPLSAMRYGPKNHRMVEHALALDAENPLAHLASGISLFNTPGTFGGDKHKALEAFARAVSLYHAGRGGATADWGLAEALVWQGLTQRELGQQEAAAQSWHEALAARPDHRWAGKLLGGGEQ